MLGTPMVNIATVLQEFASRGIFQSDTTPATILLPYHAWAALNRHVRKGQHGLRVTTITPTKLSTRDPISGHIITRHSWRFAAGAAFHLSQTQPNKQQPRILPETQSSTYPGDQQKCPL